MIEELTEKLMLFDCAAVVHPAVSLYKRDGARTGPVFFVETIAANLPRVDKRSAVHR